MSSGARDLYIGGRWVPSVSRRRLACIDPSTEEAFDTIACANANDVDRAVQAASRAFDQSRWKNQDREGVAFRANILRKVAGRIAKEKASLSKIESTDCGKPIEEADWDIDDAVACFEYYADMLDAYQFDQSVALPEDASSDFRGQIRKEALGVVALITPWNYPLLMAVWKVAPALAAGCTVVLKPSEHASLTCLELAKIAHECSCPPGVFNVVTGVGEEAGSALSRHPLVKKVAFTGSNATGKKVAHEMASQVKPCSLELGGKSALIVFDDCDIPDAVEWCMFGCFWTNGQICSATSRLILHEKIKDKFLKLLKERAESINIGNPKRKGCRLGPVVNDQQYHKIMHMVERAKSQGIKVLTGGGRPAGEGFSKGYYISPTIFVQPPETSEIWQEEIFGPVLCVRTFSSEQEAISMANNSKYGLAAAVISQDSDRCSRVAQGVNCGIVWVNCSQPCFVQLPWGGCKGSGFGRDLGTFGFENYLHVKQVVKYTSGERWDWYPGKAKAKL